MEAKDRLIVSIDVDPRRDGGIACAREKAITIAKELADLGVYIKINSILRVMGYDLITLFHSLGLRVFADLKLIDTKKTLETDAAFLAHFNPEILTVMTDATAEGMRCVKNLLPNTEVLGVTVLTNMQDIDCLKLHGAHIDIIVPTRMDFAREAKLDGIVCAAKDLNSTIVFEAKDAGLTLNTPGIRPSWSRVQNDDQKRVMRINDALKAGATRVIVGRPILEASKNTEGLPQNPREAAEWCLKEIENETKRASHVNR